MFKKHWNGTSAEARMPVTEQEHQQQWWNQQKQGHQMDWYPKPKDGKISSQITVIW